MHSNGALFDELCSIPSQEETESIGHDNEATFELDIYNWKLKYVKANSMVESGPNIPQILHLVSTVALDVSE